MKAGTTSVFNGLQAAGAICGFSKYCIDQAQSFDRGDWHRPGSRKFFVSKFSDGKEPRLLSVDQEVWEDAAAQPKKYLMCYKPSTCPSRHFLDATPDYLSSPVAPSRLVEFLPAAWLPQVRLVAVLREPISRTLSHFNMAAADKGSLPLCIDNSNRRGSKPSFAEEVGCDQIRLHTCFVRKLALVGYHKTAALAATRADREAAWAARDDATYKYDASMARCEPPIDCSGLAAAATIALAEADRLEARNAALDAEDPYARVGTGANDGEPLCVGEPEDKNDACHKWVRRDQCETNAAFMKETCARACCFAKHNTEMVQAASTFEKETHQPEDALLLVAQTTKRSDAPPHAVDASSFASVSALAAKSLSPEAFWACADTTYNTSTPVEFSVLMRSMYSPQLKSWHAPRLAQMRRAQLLVIDFKAIVENPGDSLGRIARFYGLGGVKLDELPKSNSKEKNAAESGSKVVSTIQCETRDKLAAWFNGWNQQLVADLQEAQRAGEAPPEEPPFAGFAATDVQCSGPGGGSSPTSAPAPTTRASSEGGSNTTLSSSQGCDGLSDGDSKCGQWASQGECGSNRAWMADACARACCLAGGASAETTAGASLAAAQGGGCDGLSDGDNKCGQWASKGECGSNRAWMESSCARACCLAGSGAAETAAAAGAAASSLYGGCDGLKDTDRFACEHWAVAGQCASNREWMEGSCAHACCQAGQAARGVAARRNG